MRTLRMLRDDALYRLSELSTQYSSDWDAETQIHAWSLYCEALINAGYVSLLADADPRELSLYLARAGANWRMLLERARRKEFVVPASRNQALLAEIAIADFVGASEMAKLCARERQDLEYEDEFLYAHFVDELAVELGSGTPGVGRLEPIASALSDLASDERGEVCLAIVAGNKQAFWSAVSSLAARYETELHEKSSDPSANYFSWRAAKDIWLEGLALLRIAESIGFGAPSAAVPCIPPLALHLPNVSDDGKFHLATD